MGVRLAYVRRWIGALGSEMSLLLDEQARLEDILAGPRVQPMLAVWRRYTYEERPVRTVDDGLRAAQVIADGQSGMVIGVFVGGALFPFGSSWSDESLMQAHRDHRWWERCQRETAAQRRDELDDEDESTPGGQR